jgi:hypothetical protein
MPGIIQGLCRQARPFHRRVILLAVGGLAFEPHIGFRDGRFVVGERRVLCGDTS